MAARFEGKVAVVTAGGSGIGAASARRFANEGAAVVIADLSGTRARQVAEDIAKGTAKVAWLKMDAADPEGVQAAIKLATDSFGRLDVMFNNAGLADTGLIEDLTLESWNRVLAANLTSVFLGLKYSIPIMRAQGGGAVVNTASISGLFGDYGAASYNASKAGVINLTKAAALENARHKIRVNCVCPGVTNTRVPELLGKGDPDGFRRAWGALQPLGRMGESEEIAAAVCFLASEEASFITGTTIVADGGLTAHTGLNSYL